MAAAVDDLLLASRVLAGANTGQTAASYVRSEPTDPAQRSRSGMGGPGAEPAEPPPPGPAAPGPQLAPPPPNLVRFTQPGSANAPGLKRGSPPANGATTTSSRMFASDPGEEPSEPPPTDLGHDISVLQKPRMPIIVPAAPRRAARPGRKRRRRETKEELASLYTVFYARIPPNPTAEALAAEFADKELRVLVTQNGVLINDYCEITHKYTEKTKSQKVSADVSCANAHSRLANHAMHQVETVLAMIASGVLISPDALRREVRPPDHLL